MNAAALALVSLLAATEKPKLIVTGLTAGGGVDPTVASGLTEAVTAEVSKRGFFQVVSQGDVQTLVGLERQKQLLGCSEEGASCLAELAGALGARFVMSGSVTKLGEAYQLTVQTLDSQKAQPLGRSVRISQDLGALQSQLPYAVAEATGTPLPPPPSRLLPYAMIGAGSLAVIAGGVVGLQVLNTENLVAAELKQGETNPNKLDTLESYRQRAQGFGQLRTLSLIGLAAGAALVGGGIYLNPPESGSSGGASAALTISPSGFALAGLFP